MVSFPLLLLLLELLVVVIVLRLEGPLALVNPSTLISVVSPSLSTGPTQGRLDCGGSKEESTSDEDWRDDPLAMYPLESDCSDCSAVLLDE